MQMSYEESYAKAFPFDKMVSGMSDPEMSLPLNPPTCFFSVLGFLALSDSGEHKRKILGELGYGPNKIQVVLDKGIAYHLK